MSPQERLDLIKDITEVFNRRNVENRLTDEEVSYVRLAIQREAQSIRLRQSIIEKSLTGLVWAAILFMGSVLVEWAKNHGYKSY